ncbi:HPDL protein, partial [Polypterus senegalus]|nr:4-hydroxyphenylpyruvate dioxygenase-like protein [Polypterus senegalus]MBN3290071.1 HPDL protein [Polypterus senegalus]
MAASVRRLNHVAFQIARGDRLPSTLTDRFKFDLFASRTTESVRQLAFRKGAAVFLVNELQRAVPPVSDGTEYLPDLLYDAPVSHVVNTACNACFEVDDVEGSCERLQEQGCHLLVPPLEVEDQRGKVVYCVVKSIVGNVRHTLLDRTRYTGDFLPGFQSISSEVTKEDSAGTFFDHITYASPRKSTGQVLRWYEKKFGFKRFLINRHDSADDGFVINGDGMGLRLTAMQYWQCSKVSLTLPSVEKDEPDCKFVVAESLPDQGKNQVDTFLEHHQGAGIQHIALYTNDILCTSRILMESGVQFVSPPPTYYSQFEKAQEIQMAGYDPCLLSKFGILLDTEVEEHAKNVFQVGSQNVKDTQRHLLQIFTKPLFSENTFFLELIQRRGASGFGEGNIRALWRSVQAYMDSRELAEHSR